MKRIAAGGFKDITRIASSSPVMWQNICASNRTQILCLMDKYTDLLGQLRHLIEQEDEQGLLNFFQHAKDYRDSFALPKIKSPTDCYELFVDLLDETGGIATIARILADHEISINNIFNTDILASNNISIKNIGIINNREFEEGVLHIVLKDEESLISAEKVLQKHSYVIHKR